MRRLIVIAALAFAGAAAAQQGSTREEAKEAGQAAGRDAKQGAERASDWSQEKADAAGKKMDESGQRATGDTSQASQAQAQADQQRDRMKKQDFDLEGRVSKASQRQLTLSRGEAPAATLHMDQTTKVEVDGQQARWSDLKPGQEVKASFNLKGDKPMAVEIKAETKK